MPGPARRDTTGIVAVKKSGKPRSATEAPRDTSEYRIAMSGIVIATNAAIMRPVMIQFLIVRHVILGSRLIARIGSPGCLIANLALAATSAARSRSTRG